MTLEIYGLQNCDSCRKAKKWLVAEAIAFEFHDLRKSPIDAEILRDWLSFLGPDRLINRRGTTWRALPDHEKAAQGEALVALILAQPAILKRPIFVAASGVSVGFDEQQRQALAHSNA